MYRLTNYRRDRWSLPRPGAKWLAWLLVALLAACGDAETAPEQVTQIYPEPPSQTEYAILNTDTRFTQTRLMVTNADTFAWTDCRIEVNPIEGRGGFGIDVARIEPGETVDRDLTTFVRAGQTFRTVQAVVELVDVRCSTPEGPGRRWERFSWGDE